MRTSDSKRDCEECEPKARLDAGTPWLVRNPPEIASPAARNDSGGGACSVGHTLGRLVLPLLLALAFTTQGVAQTQRSPAKAAKAAAPAGPKELGKFDDWVAATHQEAGQTICYAFTRAKNSTPALPGRAEVVLTVTQRPTGRDAVAISAGFDYTKGATVAVQVETTGLDFYTAQRSAFARNGKAVIAAFEKGAETLARSPGPREGQVVVDTFSLHGFSAAYAAINQACPVPR